MRSDVQDAIDDFSLTSRQNKQSSTPKLSVLSGDSLVVPAGAEDPEAEVGLNLQSKFCGIIDKHRANMLETILTQREDWLGH